MANSNTYLDGLNGGSQVTTLSHIQGAGLNLPVPSGEFIDLRSPNKLQQIFETPNNSKVLYTKNKNYDTYLKGPLAVPTIYTNIESGQRNKIKTAFDASLRDSARITKFLGTSAGTKFILKQLVIQGFQAHDETKIYNPASPIIAAFRMASFGLIDRPTRHIDTSNLVSGILGATGLGSIVSTIGKFAGGQDPLPSPPRSSVASEASRSGGFLGINSSTFSSLLGDGDRSDEVVTPLARPYVKDLLRGNTATNAYNASRYSKLIPPNGGGSGFFTNLLNAAGKFIQNNTLIGGILPPKQPWNANYRADEQTYDFYLKAGYYLNQSNVTKTGGPGAGGSGGGTGGTGAGGSGGGFGKIVSGILNSIGFGKAQANSSLNITQRFYHGTKTKPSLQRVMPYRIEKSRLIQDVGLLTFQRGVTSEDINDSPNQSSIQAAKDRFGKPIKVNGDPATSLKYTDLVRADRKNGTNEEYSDQLLNYSYYSTEGTYYKDAESQLNNPEDQRVKDIEKIFENVRQNIAGINGEKYQSFRFGYIQQYATEDIGFDFINKVKPNGETSKDDYTYTGRFRNGNDSFAPSRLGKIENKDRFIRPTNNTDYVNSLTVLTKNEFDDKYNSPEKFNGMGPDIIKFFFYDIVNEKYIPFNATVKGIQDSNTAEWGALEYVGRADKLYSYKGFSRTIAFNFTTVAGSIKELMPMWQRINYLASLTKPANYTNGSNGGFIVPPMLQLTLGDFFKNHFVVMNQCNINIPEDASWEILPEGMIKNDKNWFWGPNKRNFWDSTSKGMFAQVPMSADIQINMNVLEKDRPQAGRGLWGDAPVKLKDGYTSEYGDKSDSINQNIFSKNVRYDNKV